MAARRDDGGAGAQAPRPAPSEIAALLPTPSASAAPLQAPRCPLCGRPNGCAAVAAGSLDAPCWCRDVRFTPELLARVPKAERGLACICRRCAEIAATA